MTPAWGIAVLASYLTRATDVTLGDYLDHEVFSAAALSVVDPDPADVTGFDSYIKRYRSGLAIEAAAATALRATRAIPLLNWRKDPHERSDATSCR